MSFKRIAFYTVGLLAFIGLQPAVAEEAYFYHGPARITVDAIEVSGADTTTLQPSKADSPANRAYHDLTVNVYINGDTSTVDYVAACLYSYDNLSVTVDTACGYDTADTTASVNDTSYPDSNPDEVISFRWEGTDASNPQSSDWILDGQGTVDHLLDSTNSSISITTDSTTQVDANDSSLTMTKLAVTFRFALSHATANEANWRVRATVGSTSTGPDGISTTGDDKHFRAEELDTTDYGIYFFGAFATSTDAFRPSVDYGALTQNSSTIETGIITGQYWANDSVNIAIAGTDFTFTSGGNTDTIPLVENASDAVTGNKAVRLTCTGNNPDSTADFSGTGGSAPVDSDAVVVRSSVNLASNTGSIASQDILLLGQPATGESPQFASPHRCKLEYGIGATFADNDYTNQVTLGMIDANTLDTITAGSFGIDDAGNRSYPTITRPE